MRLLSYPYSQPAGQLVSRPIHARLRVRAGLISTRSCYGVFLDLRNNSKRASGINRDVSRSPVHGSRVVQMCTLVRTAMSCAAWLRRTLVHA
eukprot:scaffold130520_cov19-Prasinocladus_malaysianus.AAC.2